ncbi:MAG: FkbM family methyltransferase [Gammaproteobacteria bacterium]|nr:FkbM family methyltransferase [Gammaproteobacteria bacterium]
MSLVRFFNKFRRELYKPLSRFCIKQASVNYFGMKLQIPIIHGHGAGFLVPGDEWMSNCLSVFLKNKQGMVVDIGVNIGLYLVKLKALDRQREYLGFEPNAVCNFYTQELIRANDFENVRILPFALSDKKELRTFYTVRKGDKMGSLHEYARFGQKGKFTFDLFTFPGDEFFEMLDPEAICAFKIDVEGAELEVLRGLQATITKYRPYLFCEIWQLPEASHPTYDEKYKRLKAICDLLGGLNYSILGVDKADASSVSKLENPEEFGDKHRRDYMLVHAEDADALLQNLKKITQ